jgi:probable HAF family extracellular repeat protein
MKEKLYIILLCIPLFAGCSGSYVISALPDLGGHVGKAMDINNRGEIVGYCETEAGDFHAVLWDGSGVTDLGTLGGDDSYALGINDDGTVVGHSKMVDGKTHAFIWQDGVMIDIHDPDLPPINNSFARAINSDGLIAGTIGYAGVVWYTPSEYVLVIGGNEGTEPYFEGPSDTYDINDANQAVGWLHTHDQAFIWEDGTMELLPHLGINRSRAYGINAAGQVVGNVVNPDTHLEQAAFWDEGVMPMILGTFGGTYGKANDINDSGTIVGMSKKPDGISVPFYYKLADGEMLELMNLGSGTARSINNSGVIVGYGINAAGDEKPVKWVWRRRKLPWE